MKISSETSAVLSGKLSSSMEICCSGLILSARWAVFSETVSDGLHMIVLPDRESAEYCASDLYNMIEGDRIFFMPDSGRSLEKSNYKSSLGVQHILPVHRHGDKP